MPGVKTNPKIENGALRSSDPSIQASAEWPRQPEINPPGRWLCVYIGGDATAQNVSTLKTMVLMLAQR